MDERCTTKSHLDAPLLLGESHTVWRSPALHLHGDTLNCLSFRSDGNDQTLSLCHVGHDTRSQTDTTPAQTRLLAMAVALAAASGCGGQFGVDAVRLTNAMRASCASEASTPEVLECEVVLLSNVARAGGSMCGTELFPPARPLANQSALQKSARAYANDLAVRNYVSHTSKDGLSPFDRMEVAGYNGKFMGKNVAAGSLIPTPEDTVNEWLKSDDHCRNIMDPNYTDVGVGYARSASYTLVQAWVQHLGGN